MTGLADFLVWGTIIAAVFTTVRLASLKAGGRVLLYGFVFSWAMLTVMFIGGAR